MRLASVLLARAMVWIEVGDLNPRGVTLYPDFVKALVARYGFLKVPEKLEELDAGKGITFSTGRYGNTAIDQLVVYTYGVLVDTRETTDKSQQLLEDLLAWSSKEHGLVFQANMARRWQYASQVAFYSDVLAETMPAPIRDLATKVSKEIHDLMHEDLTYETINISIDYDQLKRKHPLGVFTIQRRDNTPFSERKYFSAAPLPTNTHIKLLEDFEKSLRPN